MLKTIVVQNDNIIEGSLQNHGTVFIDFVSNFKMCQKLLEISWRKFLFNDKMRMNKRKILMEFELINCPNEIKRKFSSIF